MIQVNFEDGKIYPAKILKVDTSRPADSGIYYVHYKNWNARHDQWISEDMIADSRRTDLGIVLDVKEKQVTKKIEIPKSSPPGFKNECKNTKDVSREQQFHAGPF